MTFAWVCVGVNTSETVRAILIAMELWHFWTNHLAGKSEYLLLFYMIPWVLFDGDLLNYVKLEMF